jgi:hypothetical protein
LNRWCSLALVLAASCAWAEVQPSSAMLQPVHDLVSFMSTLPTAQHPRVFANAGLCIIENFPPYLFCGARAAALWESGFRAHSKDDGLTELAAHFDAAHDFSQVGDRVYFSLPTTWTGRTHGHTFEEHGAWSFVLIHQPAAGWRIAGYGWGVTAYAEQGQSAHAMQLPLPQ